MTMETFDFAFLERFDVPVKAYETGDVIFSAEEKGYEMFVVLSGRINITFAGIVLESVRPSGIFGELALIDQAPRSANAVAAEAARLAVIDEALFVQMVVENPLFSLYVMRQLARRIRQMNKSL